MPLADITWFDQLPTAMRVTLIMFLAIMGGSVGSFMNVVVWRMPRGKSLLYPGSACPRCGHAIRGWHNIPVLGWFLLGGKCYDCGKPIAARYPRVEAGVLILFLAFAFAGPFSVAANDPLASLSPEVKERLEVQYMPSPESSEVVRAWANYGLEMLVLCTLLCAALIQWDSNDPPEDLRFPKLLFLVPWAIVVAAVVAWPAVGPGEADETPSRPFVLANVLLGTATGAAVALLSWPALGAGPLGRAGRAYGVAASALVGALLGTQAVAWIGAVAAIGFFLCRDLARFLSPALKRLSWLHLLWTATAAHLLLASYVTVRSTWFSLALIALCSVFLWFTQPARSSDAKS